MRGPTRQPEQRLAELEQRKAQILNKIARLRNVESAKARKRDTRRKILAGSWVLAEAERDPALSQRLRKGLDTFLERDGDREVWGLMPRPKPSDASEPPAAPAEPADELAPDPNKPPLAGWTPRQLDQGWGAVLEGAPGGRPARERPAARHADRRHRPTGRRLDHDPHGRRQPKRHRDRGHQYRPAAPVRPHGRADRKRS